MKPRVVPHNRPSQARTYGLMLAGELALARIDVAIVERRENQERAYYARVGAPLPQSGVQWRPFARGR